MENYVIEGSTLSSLDNFIYSDLLNNEISVVGYGDLSHDKGKFRPSEIVIGTSNDGRGHLSRLLGRNGSISYELTHYTVAPGAICDILPIYFSQEAHLFRMRTFLVLTRNNFIFEVWIVNLSEMANWYRVMSLDTLILFKGREKTLLSRLKSDYDKKAIEVVLYAELDDLDESNLSNDSKTPGNLDLTSRLSSIKVNIEETLAYNLSFVTEYK